MTETVPETARLTADAVLFGERDNTLYALVIRRGWPPYEGCWALPGGHVDLGEHVQAAAHRELTEETGLSVAALKFVGVYADPGRDPRGRYVTFAYTTRLTHTPQPTAADDATDARWMPVHELLSPGAHLAFDHARILHDALRRVI
jgi:8-oxo-dGTP diphosphatase